ncbi:MAG TPA: DUF4440 domain-containing protein [Puia sp.]|nr:DUF4440 domain-containing protein [Puia sp.]
MTKHFALLVSLIAATNFLPTCTFGAPKDSLEVRKAVMGFQDDWNHHDMAAFGRLFTMNAYFVNVAGAPMKGRDEIQLHHAWSHAAIPADSKVSGTSPGNYGIFKNSTMHFTRIDINFLRKDVAVAHVSWELQGDARTPDPRHGVFMFVLTFQNKTWLIATAQNTEGNSKALQYLISTGLRK